VSITAVRSSICVERRELTRREPIGESGSAVVDHDHPSEPSQSIEDVRLAGQLPVEEQVRDEPGDIDEVARTLPEDLERDVRPIRRLRVANLGDVHRRMVLAPRLPRKSSGAAGLPVGSTL
jgi:hypothetical protein